MNSNKKIRVVMGTNITRESVLLDGQGNVIDEGTSSSQLLKKHYGRN